MHPHIPVTSSQGLVRRPMRGQDLSCRLYAEHRSCREVIPLGNFPCKCDLSGWNTVNQRSIHHQFNRTGKLHGSWETLLVFWGRARFHGSTVLFWIALVLNTVLMDSDPAPKLILLFSSMTNRVPTKNKCFFQSYFAYYVLNAHLHQYSKIKSQKEVTI